jgi:hypothetical protein
MAVGSGDWLGHMVNQILSLNATHHIQTPNPKSNDTSSRRKENNLKLILVMPKRI